MLSISQIARPAVICFLLAAIAVTALNLLVMGLIALVENCFIHVIVADPLLSAFILVPPCVRMQAVLPDRFHDFCRPAARLAVRCDAPAEKGLFQ